MKGHSILENGFSSVVSQLQRGYVGKGMGKVVGDGKRQVHGGCIVQGLVFLIQEYEYHPVSC